MKESPTLVRYTQAPIGFHADRGFAYNTGMRRLPRSPLFVLVEYLLALLLVGLTTLALQLFGSVLDTQITTVGYLLPVVASTLLWGLGPGVVAALAAFFAFNYFFIEPRYTWVIGCWPMSDAPKQSHH
jgi:K+-sensing histidine kinase KdpD